MNTSNVMGVALLVFGVALAVTAGASGDRNAVVLGFIGAVALFYMGIGLYSRGNTEEGLLRSSDATTKRSTLYRTSSYVAGAASVGALLAFGIATAEGASLFVRLVFGVVFIYTFPVALWLRKMSASSDADEREAVETADDAGAT
ncbi:MAG: hypothetical protein U5J64_06485 [Halobacteriales archaeon]|nr:hypothetical protein [Halobacteriales archaeon]